MNLESVCSILTGLHKIYQENLLGDYAMESWIKLYKGQSINFTPEDYREKDHIKLNKLMMLNHDFFENDIN